MSEVVTVSSVENNGGFLPKISEKAIEELKRQYDMFRELQRRVLEEGVDYGWPAGKREGKPSLYKSGAEKLTRLFNLVPNFETLKLVEDENFIEYIFKCVLKTPNGLIVGEGFGAANSREKAHWRRDPWANQNTILKMAKKRAHVDAVLTGLGASNVFTQDIEDYEEVDVEEDLSEPPATEAQIRKIHVALKEYCELSGKDMEVVKQNIKKNFGVEHINELTKRQASELIEQLEKYIQKHRKSEVRT